MNASPAQQRRAKNIVWSSAENYEFESPFLSFDHLGEANFYLNLIVGLVYKWLDWEKLAVLFNRFEGTVLESTYDGLLWLALEQVVYERELPQRPVLEFLREEHSKKMTHMSAWLVETDRVMQFQIAWCQENLGKKPFMMPRDLRLLRALRFDSSWDTERIIAEFTLLMKQFFKVDLSQPARVPKERRPSKLRMLFRKRRQVPARMFRARDLREVEEGAGKAGQPGKVWAGGSSKVDRDTLAQLEKRFGPQYLSSEDAARVEKDVCTDIHNNNHLYFAAPKIGSPDYMRNRAHYQEHRAAYDNVMRRLRDRLKNQLTVDVLQDKIKSSSGHLNCTKVWRNQYLEDNRIFLRRQDEPQPIFSVDILIDSSQSQSSRQGMLAAQGYIIAESLCQCGVPVQVHSFNSFRTYTVLQRLRGYESSQSNENLFCYTAEGWNRDGLALRAMGKIMEDAPEQNRLLVILTDADPNDECGISLYQEYSGRDGIKDAAGEVDSLRKKGIKVVAVFMGLDYNVETAKKIYGNDFVRIKEPTQLAEAISSIIRRKLRDW